MDFGQLLSQQDQDAPIEPRELYEALPNKAAGYGYLRDVQGQILAAWHQRRDESDLVVKVNTGGGKTINGLVILQSYLNAGEGPALYVAPSNYLVEQVIAEAENIGVATVTNPDAAAYLHGEAIAVVSIHKLVNGRSVFAAGRAPKAPAPIGVVIIDDAHAALATSRAQLSISIPRASSLFDELLELFSDALEMQSRPDLLDVRDRSAGALARVPFWSWRENLSRVHDLLHENRDEQCLRYSWPAIAPVLDICRAVFGSNGMSITPPLPPIGHIASFREAAHRIYLTATLADDSVLITDFGAESSSISNPITPATASDIGERMIIAPSEILPDVEIDDVRAGIADFAENANVVVITPSDRSAEHWRTLGATVLSGEDISSAVERLKTTQQSGLTVFVNRYDGIDLPDDACRVLVIDGLPEAFSPDERIESQVRSRIDGVDDRQIQRLEQGMGRGVRSNEDHCVVFLLGARLGQLVNDPRYLARFSPATQAQLKLSRTVAQGMGSSLENIFEVAQQVLERDRNWIQLAKGALRPVKNAQPSLSSHAAPRRTAMDFAVEKNFRGAASSLDAALDKAADAHEKGWLLEQKAVYVDLFDPTEGQKILGKARANNGAVMRPLVMPPYQRLSTSADQARNATAHLSRYSSETALRLGFEAILGDLVFAPQRHKEFERAFAELGLHLGLAAERPEQELGAGPDVLWSLGGGLYWIIEAKSEATTTIIHKRDINQLAGSSNWFAQRYPTDAIGTPVIVHPSRTLATDASGSPNMMALQEDGLTRLRDSVRALAVSLAATRWDDPSKAAALLLAHKVRSTDLSLYLKAVKASK